MHATQPAKSPVAAERLARRRRIDVAYGCWLWIALYLAVASLLDWLFGSPGTPGELTRWQGIGMLVILPLTLSALAAAIVGGRSSLRLWRDWSQEPGLVVLPIALAVMLAIFGFREADMLGERWLELAAAGYVLAGAGFFTRWIVSGRRRYAAGP